MADRIITTEEMELLGAMLPHMTREQLHLVKNRIEQILFERMVEGNNQYNIKVENDPDAPFGIKIELPPELQALIDKNMGDLKVAMEKLNEASAKMQNDFGIDKLEDMDA